MGFVVISPSTNTSSNTTSGATTPVADADITDANIGKYVVNILFPDDFLLRLGIYNGGEKTNLDNYEIIDSIE